MRAIERFEQRHAVLQQFVILTVNLAKALDERANLCRICAAETSILQIQVVHDLGDLAHSGIRHAERCAEDLEGAAFALVRESPPNMSKVTIAREDRTSIQRTGTLPRDR